MITLHIKCHNDSEQNEALRELGIESESKYEWRDVRIKPSAVNYYYPNPDGGCFMNVGGDDITVSESFEELEELI